MDKKLKHNRKEKTIKTKTSHLNFHLNNFLNPHLNNYNPQPNNSNHKLNNSLNNPLNHRLNNSNHLNNSTKSYLNHYLNNTNLSNSLLNFNLNLNPHINLKKLFLLCVFVLLLGVWISEISLGAGDGKWRRNYIVYTGSDIWCEYGTHFNLSYDNINLTTKKFEDPYDYGDTIIDVWIWEEGGCEWAKYWRNDLEGNRWDQLNFNEPYDDNIKNSLKNIFKPSNPYLLYVDSYGVNLFISDSNNITYLNVNSNKAEVGSYTVWIAVKNNKLLNFDFKCNPLCIVSLYNNNNQLLRSGKSGKRFEVQHGYTIKNGSINYDLSSDKFYILNILLIDKKNINPYIEFYQNGNSIKISDLVDYFGSSPPEANCKNGQDDDFDGKTDCEDPDCAEKLGPNNKKCCQSNNNCDQGYECKNFVCTQVYWCDEDGDEWYKKYYQWQTNCQTQQPNQTGDCNDNDASINPGAQEICNDGKDNDCDWKPDCQDEDCEVECQTCQITPLYTTRDEIISLISDDEYIYFTKPLDNYDLRVFKMNTSGKILHNLTLDLTNHYTYEWYVPLTQTSNYLILWIDKLEYGYSEELPELIFIRKSDFEIAAIMKSLKDIQSRKNPIAIIFNDIDNKLYILNSSCHLFSIDVPYPIPSGWQPTINYVGYLEDNDICTKSEIEIENNYLILKKDKILYKYNLSDIVNWEIQKLEESRNFGRRISINKKNNDNKIAVIREVGPPRGGDVWHNISIFDLSFNELKTFNLPFVFYGSVYTISSNYYIFSNINENYFSLTSSYNNASGGYRKIFFIDCSQPPTRPRCSDFGNFVTAERPHNLCSIPINSHPINSHYAVSQGCVRNSTGSFEAKYDQFCGLNDDGYVYNIIIKDNKVNISGELYVCDNVEDDICPEDFIDPETYDTLSCPNDPDCALPSQPYPNITQAFWADPVRGNKINEIAKGDSVKIAVKVENAGQDDKVNVTVYRVIGTGGIPGPIEKGTPLVIKDYITGFFVALGKFITGKATHWPWQGYAAPPGYSETPVDSFNNIPISEGWANISLTENNYGGWLPNGYCNATNFCYFYFIAKMADNASINKKSNRLYIHGEEFNKPPVARIVYPHNGDDFKINGTNIKLWLNETSYDPDGYIESWVWKIIDNEGNVETLRCTASSPGSSCNKTHNFGLGSYTIKLEVTDDKGAIDIDEISISIWNEQYGAEPIAIISEPEEGETLKNSTVKFNASLSYDPDDCSEPSTDQCGIEWYYWNFDDETGWWYTSYPVIYYPYILQNPTQEYTAELYVQDDEGNLSSTVDVTFTIDLTQQPVCYCEKDGYYVSCGQCLDQYYCENHQNLVEDCRLCNYQCPSGYICNQQNGKCVEEQTSDDCEVLNKDNCENPATGYSCFWEEDDFINECRACQEIRQTGLYCSGYKTEYACENDSFTCNVAWDACGQEPNCWLGGQNSNPRCEWNGSACKFVYSYQQDGQQIDCRQTITLDPPQGCTEGVAQVTKHIEWEYNNNDGTGWWKDNQQPYKCGQPTTENIACPQPPALKMPGWSWINVVAVLLLLSAYYIWKLSRRKEGRERRKSGEKIKKRK